MSAYRGKSGPRNGARSSPKILTMSVVAGETGSAQLMNMQGKPKKLGRFERAIRLSRLDPMLFSTFGRYCESLCLALRKRRIQRPCLSVALGSKRARCARSSSFGPMTHGHR